MFLLNSHGNNIKHAVVHIHVVQKLFEDTRTMKMNFDEYKKREKSK